MNQPIGPENDGIVEFPGYILRQSLINFCRNQVVEIASKQEAIEGVLDFSKWDDPKFIPTKDEAILSESYSANIGEQRAYRAICTWAENHNTPPQAMEVRTPDTDLPKQTPSENEKFYQRTTEEFSQ